MMYRVSRRGVAAGAATALAIGTLTVFGTSVADAAPIVRDWADGKTSFNRTISNGTPGVGETINVTTKWRRTDNVTETINWATDVNPPCLTYVPGSAKINGNPVTPAVNPNRGGTPPSGTVAVSGLTLVNAPGTNNPSYSVDYIVGANCALGTTLQTGMDYGGDRGAGYYGFGGPNITAGKGNPTTTLSPVTGAKIGQSTTLTANVTGGGSATGNPVEFYDGATKIGQGNLGAAGNVTTAWTPTTAGAHALTARFLGTALANQSVSAVQNVTVTPADVTTTTTVTGPADAVAGTDVTLGVQVSPIPTGGTVQFKDGGTNIGGPVTLDAQGKGSLTQQFATGTRNITAVYAGSAQFLTSTSAVHAIAVTPANVNTTTTVTGDSTGVVGSNVALHANVSPAPALGGKVQFKDGDTNIGDLVDLDAQGNASITAPLAAGNHAITAVFAGFNEHQASTSTAHTVTVSPANENTTTTVTGPA
ncbi:hypothetical protein B2J88_36390, partial [Rhodococcus sp. SRB_17]|nr:hypothetical protein [Rhodococcus sp. SRB_17]